MPESPGSEIEQSAAERAPEPPPERAVETPSGPGRPDESRPVADEEKRREAEAAATSLSDEMRRDFAVVVPDPDGGDGEVTA